MMARMSQTQAEKDQLLTQLAALGGGVAAAPLAPEEPVAGVPVNPFSEFAPMRSNVYNFDGADKTFRLLDYKPDTWAVEAALKGKALNEEAVWTNSTAFYMGGVSEAVQVLCDASADPKDLDRPLADFRPHLLDLRASTERLTEAVQARAAYLKMRAAAPPRGDPTGELANVEQTINVRYGAAAATGSRLVDSQRTSFAGAVNSFVVQILAREQAARGAIAQSATQ